MPKRILVVDDESDVRDFVALVLESAGYEVMRAADGSEAILAVEAAPVDLMVLDLMMPIMDGYGVLEAMGKRRPPVIVVLSAAANRDKAQELGAEDILSKPFSPRGLIAAVRRLLGEDPVEG